MKKNILLLIVSVIILTGCTIVRIDTTEIDNIVDVILSKENDLYNRIGKGYNYYVPRGVTYIDTDELNEKLYSNGNYYYLYVDAISYYYETEVEYEENKNAYYSKPLDYNGHKGYLEINEVDGKYLIEFMYNYSKIEALVLEDEINDVVLDSSYILSTVKFNHNIIKIMLDDEFFTNREEKYDIFSPKSGEITNLLETDKESE